MNDMDSVRIERTFDAAISQVWQMWTDGERFSKWYGPQGFTIPVAQMDVRIGGRRLICMEMAARGMKMWFTGEFREVVPPTRLVYTESMSDESGNVISPASMGMPDQPEVTEVIVELEEVDGRTKMTMRHVGVPAGSPGEGGWQMAFDKLQGLFG